MRPKPAAILAIAAMAAVPPALVLAQDEDAAAPVPDISITATLRARSVTFHSTPDVRVELTGMPERRDVDRTLRDNLPEDIHPGRTYHDVGIRFEASTTLDPAAVDPLPPEDEAPP